MSVWTSAHMWSSYRVAKEKQRFWLHRADAHLSRKKPCEDCAFEKEAYGSYGCGIWFDAYEKSEKWGRDASHARTQAQRKEREEGVPVTIDGTKTADEVRREENERMERKFLQQQEQEA